MDEGESIALVAKQLGCGELVGERDRGVLAVIERERRIEFDGLDGERVTPIAKRRSGRCRGIIERRRVLEFRHRLLEDGNIVPLKQAIERALLVFDDGIPTGRRENVRIRGGRDLRRRWFLTGLAPDELNVEMNPLVGEVWSLGLTLLDDEH